MDELLVHQHHARSTRVIVLGECATAQDGHARRPEIICRHHCIRSGGLLIRLCFLLAPDVNGNAARSGRRQVRGNSHLFYARYCCSCATRLRTNSLCLDESTYRA